MPHKVSYTTVSSAPKEKPKSTRLSTPNYIVFLGEQRNVKTWQDVKKNFFSSLVENYPKSLTDWLYELSGRNGKDYAVRGDDIDRRSFRKPGQIDSMDIWIKFHGSSNDLVQGCRAVLTKLGIKQDEFEIFCENPSYKI